MKVRISLAATLFFAFTSVVNAQQPKESASAAKADAKSNRPDLRFREDGKDLLVSIWIEGPAARQIVLTECSINDGKPSWEVIIRNGKDTPHHTPTISLRYLVLVNRNLPGFTDKNLMTLPTPPDVRQAQRQEVTWRLPNFQTWGFKMENATIKVEGSEFETSSDELLKALPRIQKTIDDSRKESKGRSAP